MAGLVVVGAQWGDEGKGKLVDLLTQHAEMVVRFQGGSNAGHTVYVGNKTFVLHLIPSGIFHAKTVSVLGNGVVIDPQALLKEIQQLQAGGVNVAKNLRISRTAHLVMPYHKAFDLLREKLRGAGKIGTTGRGIGPTYEDKMARRGIRFCDLEELSADNLRLNLTQILAEKNLLLHQLYGSQQAPLQADAILQEYLQYHQQLKPFLCDASQLVNQALDAGKLVLFEGAQGCGLDVDHGSYPYVTSSNTVAGGACTGSGVGPTRISQVLGITKAYTTRVGEGPFPTELQQDPVGEHLSQQGQELGSTTGRTRRCGWFDAVIVKQAVRLSSITVQALTKLDVLSGLKTLKIAHAWCDDQGNHFQDAPHHFSQRSNLRPVYEELPGWQTSLRNITQWQHLPPNAQRYVQRIETLTGVPASIISVGPHRHETIWREPLLQLIK